MARQANRQLHLYRSKVGANGELALRPASLPSVAHGYLVLRMRFTQRSPIWYLPWWKFVLLRIVATMRPLRNEPDPTSDASAIGHGRGIFAGRFLADSSLWLQHFTVAGPRADDFKGGGQRGRRARWTSASALPLSPLSLSLCVTRDGTRSGFSNDAWTILPSTRGEEHRVRGSQGLEQTALVPQSCTALVAGRCKETEDDASPRTASKKKGQLPSGTLTKCLINNRKLHAHAQLCSAPSAPPVPTQPPPRRGHSTCVCHAGCREPGHGCRKAPGQILLDPGADAHARARSDHQSGHLLAVDQDGGASGESVR